MTETLDGQSVALKNFLQRTQDDITDALDTGDPVVGLAVLQRINAQLGQFINVAADLVITRHRRRPRP